MAVATDFHRNSLIPLQFARFRFLDDLCLFFCATIIAQAFSLVKCFPRFFLTFKKKYDMIIRLNVNDDRKETIWMRENQDVDSLYFV